MQINNSSTTGLLVVGALIVGGIAWNAAPLRAVKDPDRQVVFGVAAIATGQTARLNVVLDNPNSCPPTPVEFMFIDADGNIEQSETLMVASGHAAYSDMSAGRGAGGADLVGDGNASRHRFRASARFVDDPNIKSRCRGAGTATVEVIDNATGKTETFADNPAILIAGWGTNHNETLVRDETPR